MVKPLIPRNYYYTQNIKKYIYEYYHKMKCQLIVVFVNIFFKYQKDNNANEQITKVKKFPSANLFS